MFKVKLQFLILVALLGSLNTGYAQHKKTRHRSVRDSLRGAVLKRDSLMRSFKQSNGSINGLFQKIEYYNSSYNQDLSDYTQGFDTVQLSKSLPATEHRMAIMGSLISNYHSGTVTYLFTIRDLLTHFKEDLDNWQDELTADNNKLNKIHDDASEFKKDTALKTVPSDSSLQGRYLMQMNAIEAKWKKLDSTTQKGLIKIGLLQNRVTTLDLLMLDVNDQIDLKVHDFTAHSLSNEYGYIWEYSTDNVVKFDTVINKTYRLNSRLLKYFFDPSTTSRINIISHLAAIIIFGLFLGWIFSSKRRLRRLQADSSVTLNQTHYVVKHAIISSLAIALIFCLYLYDHPPFIFLEMVLILLMLCMGVLIRPVWPNPLFKFWTALFVLTILYAIANLFTQVSFADRVLMLIFSALSIAAGYLFLRQLKNPDNYPKYIRLFIKTFVVCHIIAFVLNLIGRFSLSKIIAIATDFNLCLALGFYMFIQILMESLFLQLEANKIAHVNFSSYVDFKVLQSRFKSILVKAATILWIVKLLENLDIDDYIYGKLGDFLTHSYSVGKTEFTFGSVVIFVVVIYLSIIISRVISYFYDYADQQSAAAGSTRKNRTSVLLIRLSVFAVGFIAAIVFSGIPLTEITIIVGALGVGIGFGLQNIVNNLVSGVILAFEKPVQVGDIIEVGNRSGKIVDIGIRASKIEAGDGSELIVPNGDLISQHVVNWTLTNNNRRVELIVGVAYGSDVEKVEGMLKKIVRGRKDIMQSPAPLVFLHNFSDSSVDFRLLFWAADINKWLSLKSDVMAEIYTEFAKEGIEIPHPKRDIQVFFPEGTSAEIKNADDVKGIINADNPPKEIAPKKSPAPKGQ